MMKASKKDDSRDLKKKTPKSDSKKSNKKEKVLDPVVTEGSVKFSKKEKKKSNKDKKLDKESLKKYNLDVLDLLIIVVVTAIVSCLLTGCILNNQFKKINKLYDYELISDENINDFLSTYSEIVKNYYEEIDEKKMVQAAISGMMNFLEDNYSIYLDKEESEDLNDMLDSSYEGIGLISLGNVVYEVYKNSPADKAGIKTGDEIVSVNGEAIDNKNYDKISTLIAENDDLNEVIVLRNGKRLTFNVEKNIISIPVVNKDIIEKNKKKIGYMRIDSFSTRSYEEVVEALIDFDKDKIDSLIIDLRDNSGGYLLSVKNIANLFLEEGKIIYSLEDKKSYDVIKDNTKESKTYPIIVLVNSQTASAAEILAASLKDSYGAILIGKTTFGKGKVQNVMNLDDSIVKYTSAKWYRPNGECIDEIGIVPDYDISLEYKGNTIYDKQLDKAIDLLK